MTNEERLKAAGWRVATYNDDGSPCMYTRDGLDRWFTWYTESAALAYRGSDAPQSEVA